MSGKMGAMQYVIGFLLLGVVAGSVSCGDRAAVSDLELGPTPVRLRVDGVSLYDTSAALLLLPPVTDDVPELVLQVTVHGMGPGFGRVSFTLEAFRRLVEGELVESGAATRSDIHGDVFLRQGASIAGVLRTIAFDSTLRTMTLTFEESVEGHQIVLELMGEWPMPLCYPNRVRLQHDDPDVEFGTQECREWLVVSGADQI